ncbi:hypothetical protein CspHIS471_0500530 [Cutaneotrichosporon sp. HIS471]|nr:hypothetical protein CspHIS471_0500530 [Cutaneotrichosporon sp. HIS471]
MSGWEVRWSNSRSLPYYYNGSTGQSTWERPAEISEDAAKNLPGAKYLSANAAPEGKVRASHILAKHTGSRRPSSWKQQNITRTLPEARAQIQGYLATIQALPADKRAAEFAKIASTESDCSSARSGGDLGLFGRGQMQKAFEDGTYALEVGEISPLIESDSGVHIILRTA